MTDYIQPALFCLLFVIYILLAMALMKWIKLITKEIDSIYKRSAPVSALNNIQNLVLGHSKRLAALEKKGKRK